MMTAAEKITKLEMQNVALCDAIEIIADRIAGIHVDKEGTEYECESCNAAIEIAREAIANAEVE